MAIDTKDLGVIESLGESGEYERQGKEFLKRCGVFLVVQKSNTKEPPWMEKGQEFGHHYRCTLAREKPISEGNKGDFINQWTFDFWDSIQAKKEGSSKPTAYSVLACLDYAGDTEEDVVDSATDMGLNLRQGLGYLEEQRNIRAFFLPSEREALNSIR